MAAKAFVSRVLQINRGAAENEFNVSIEVTIMGVTQDTGVNLSFTAQWGSDWRMMARQAIIEWNANNGTGDVVDGVVFPDMTTA
jgi:hypothetical protein